MILFLSESRKFPSECFHKNSFGFRLNEEFVVAPRPKKACCSGDIWCEFKTMYPLVN